MPTITCCSFTEKLYSCFTCSPGYGSMEAMIFRKPPKIAFCVVPLILTMIAAAASAQSMFLMGEDVVHPSGLILSVNSMQRRPFASGLGVSRQDEVFINMTFVNTGVSTCRIDPRLFTGNGHRRKVPGRGRAGLGEQPDEGPE